MYGNRVVFGSVNAARRHYDQAANALAQADPGWLAQLITRRVTPEEWPLALKKRPEDIKIVIEMAALREQRLDVHPTPERKPTMTSDPVACTTEQCQLGRELVGMIVAASCSGSTFSRAASTATRWMRMAPSFPSAGPGERHRGRRRTDT